MRVLMATAELTPLASTGGLGAAVSGLVRALRSRGDLEVELVLPDYGGVELGGETVLDLSVPSWAGWARARSGTHPTNDALHLVSVPAMARPHPYVDPVTGVAWADNDRRFFSYCAGVAALAEELDVDVVHINDWHTAAVLPLLAEPRPSVLTIHNLAYQGNADAMWLDLLGPRSVPYRRYDHTIPLAGAIASADRVIAVSPNYANEIRTPEGGMGLYEDLVARGDDLVGIRNGIDVEMWDPSTDTDLPTTYDRGSLGDRPTNTAALRRQLGLAESSGPLIGTVTRFTHQKGVDRVLALTPYLAGMDAQLVILGSGDPDLAAAGAAAAAADPARVALIDDYDPVLAHRIFGAADLFAMPSRFEPCGLAQMQAMQYGCLPVVTDVGGLHDTVTDLDADDDAGTGFVAVTNDDLGWLDVVHRAVRGWRDLDRRRRAQRNGMSDDWSWDEPAAEHVAIYREITGPLEA
ncbi:MAG: glycogen/starch synthase [Actinomycetota bacterium]